MAPDYAQRSKEQQQKEAALLKAASILFSPQTEKMDLIPPTDGHIVANQRSLYNPPLRTKRRIASLFLDGYSLSSISVHFGLELDEVRDVLNITKESICSNCGPVAVGTVAMLDRSRALCKKCWRLPETEIAFPPPFKATIKPLSKQRVFKPATLARRAKKAFHAKRMCDNCGHKEMLHGPLLYVGVEPNVVEKRGGCGVCPCVEYHLPLETSQESHEERGAQFELMTPFCETGKHSSCHLTRSEPFKCICECHGR
jgi:hypothetical protein